MFNFKSLKPVKRCDSESNSSFVGIRRGINNELEFRLPHGFDEFPEQDFDETKRLFFRMYSTFRKFERDDTRKNILDERPAGKDNIATQGNGYRFKDKEDNEVILYSKIALIENLLEAYRDLALDVMERRIGQDERVDYSKIEHYLHRAVYLPNDVIFIDEMDLPRQTLHYEAMALIDLFCFILSELQTELEQETDTRVQELAHRFAEQHLNHAQSLFNEETFEITIQTLKDALDDIDKRTTYKDDDYWRLYEAIELFLYGELDMEEPHENGIYWGINNFSSVWEDMCATYAFANFDVVYADTNIIFNGERIKSGSQKSDFISPFFVGFRDKKRWMRPDLIKNTEEKQLLSFDTAIKITIIRDYGMFLDFRVGLIDKNINYIYKDFILDLKKELKYVKGARISENNFFKNFPKNSLEKLKFQYYEMIKKANNIIKESIKNILILDWKYMGSNCFVTSNQKVKTDITKQLCYEFSLQKLKPNSSIESQFIIPWFYYEPEGLEDIIGDFMDDNTLYPRIRDNEIKVFKANFSKIQTVYLTHD